MSIIKIATDGNTTTLRSPYHPNLPTQAKALGGKFDSFTKAWNFDARDEERVREMAIGIYGTDGTDTETVTVRIEVGEGNDLVSRDREALYLGGQEIARAFGRDSGAKLGDGVVVIEGRAESGGSAKNWDARLAAGTVVEIRDVPRGFGERIVEQAAEHGRIADAKIVDEASDRREALEAERAKLLARIAEIDAELNL